MVPCCDVVNDGVFTTSSFGLRRPDLYIWDMRPFHLVLGILATFAAGDARAGPVTLDEGLRREIAGLDNLHGQHLAPGALERRVVVVAFFASWCPPCHAEFRHLIEIDAEFRGRGVTTVAINLFEGFGGLSSPAMLRAFLEKHDPAFAAVSGTAPIKRAFGDVRRIPTVFVFDGAGCEVFRFIHEQGAAKTNATAAELRAAIEPQL